MKVNITITSAKLRELLVWFMVLPPDLDETLKEAAFSGNGRKKQKDGLYYYILLDYVITGLQPVRFHG